jgi:hypothetical protein
VNVVVWAAVGVLPPVGTAKDKCVGETVTTGACAPTAAPKQQTAANTVIERTTTFHAIMSFLLEALDLAIISRNFVPCGAFQ